MSKKTFLMLTFLFIIVASLTVSVSAQYEEEPSTTDDAAFSIFCLMYMCALIIVPVIVIILALWVYNDAKSLGIENAWLWGLLVFLSWLIGLIVYFAIIRPKAKQEQGMRQMTGSRYGGGAAYAGLDDIPRKDGYCRHCGKFVGATVGRCTFCGSNL
jgi:hypothetical protein